MEREENKKVPPKQFLKSNYSHAMSIISFHHKDTLGRENQTYNMSD